MKVKQSLLPADYMTVYILCSYIIITKFSVFRNICLSSSVKEVQIMQIKIVLHQQEKFFYKCIIIQTLKFE